MSTRSCRLMLMKHFVWLTSSGDARARVGDAVVSQVWKVLRDEGEAAEGVTRVVEDQISADPEAWGLLVMDLAPIVFGTIDDGEPGVCMRGVKAWWQLVKIQGGSAAASSGGWIPEGASAGNEAAAEQQRQQGRVRGFRGRRHL